MLKYQKVSKHYDNHCRNSATWQRVRRSVLYGFMQCLPIPGSIKMISKCISDLLYQFSWLFLLSRTLTGKFVPTVLQLPCGTEPSTLSLSNAFSYGFMQCLSMKSASLAKPVGSQSFCSFSQVGSIEVGRGAGSSNLPLSNALLKAKFRKTPLSWLFPFNPRRQMKICNHIQQLLGLQCWRNLYNCKSVSRPLLWCSQETTIFLEFPQECVSSLPSFVVFSGTHPSSNRK